MKEIWTLFNADDEMNEQLNDPPDYSYTITGMQGYALQFNSLMFNLADKTLRNLPDVKSTQSLQGG